MYTVRKLDDTTISLRQQPEVGVRLTEHNIFTLSYRKYAPNCVGISD